VRFSDKVAHGHVVAASEAFLVVFSSAGRDVRMTILFSIVDIGHAVIVEVFAGAFDAVVKALALDFAKLRRWSIPPVSVVIPILGIARGNGA
jgi:hypothetical protein